MAYGKLLPKAVLDIPPRGCINVHGSLLPRWRGAAPIQWAVIAGRRESRRDYHADGRRDWIRAICCSHTKPQSARAKTAGELFDRLAQAGAKLLVETLEKLDQITPRPQDDSQSCYAHMLDKAMAVIDWTKSAREIDCLVRGLNPWPVALTTLAGARLKIYAAEPVSGAGKPGEVLESEPKKGPCRRLRQRRARAA